jgi:hypothetical protein
LLTVTSHRSYRPPSTIPRHHDHQHSTTAVTSPFITIIARHHYFHRLPLTSPLPSTSTVDTPIAATSIFHGNT